MAADDRTHWDEKYLISDRPASAPSLPAHFEPFAEELAAVTDVLEIACGIGRASVWLAIQGARVAAYDVSPVAIDQATQLAAARGVADRCAFAVADFDDGLPPGQPVDLVLCNMFRDASLDDAVIQRLRPGGLVAIAALSEVGASPGRFRVTSGELPACFAALEPLASSEGDGLAWLVARKP